MAGGYSYFIEISSLAEAFDMFESKTDLTKDEWLRLALYYAEFDAIPEFALEKYKASPKYARDLEREKRRG